MGRASVALAKIKKSPQTIAKDKAYAAQMRAQKKELLTSLKKEELKLIPCWIVERVSQWPTKVVQVHYLRGYQMELSSAKEPRCWVVSPLNNRRQCKPRTDVLLQLPEGAIDCTFEELHGQSTRTGRVLHTWDKDAEGTVKRSNPSKDMRISTCRELGAISPDERCNPEAIVF